MSERLPCKCCGCEKVQEVADQMIDGTAHTLFYYQCQRCLIRTNGAFNCSDAMAQWNNCMGLEVKEII